ncbi:MAG: hypothetical protein J2P17_31570 [Mycobacterium sp.]|nr:hypothetical protein [Mycobacterium sp.]
MRTLAAALCATIYVFGSIPIPTDTGRHHNDDDCVPTGVVTHPSGAVYGEEDCHGKKVYTRLSP